MKKKWKLFLGGILVALIMMGIVTQVKAKRVEQELKDASTYIGLVSSNYDLDWKKTNLFLMYEFVVNVTGAPNYFVTPFWSGFVRGMIDFGLEKLEYFPEDIWAEYDFIKDGTYYYPGDKEAEVDWEKNTYLAVSFDRPYTLEEVMQVEELVAARWFWIDTIGDSEHYIDGYKPSPSVENCAYGVSCEKENLLEACERWIGRLDSYENDSKTKSGQRIYMIKENINGSESIRLDDIRIIGCEVMAYGYKKEKEQMKENPMFHIVQDVNE